MHLTKYFQDYKIRQKIRYSFYTIIVILSIGCLATNVTVKEDSTYTDFDHVAMYIYEYDTLPDNYVPKFQSYLLEDDDFTVYATFRNYEQLLPLDTEYTEAYINARTDDKGAERFVFTSGIVYFTSDHYESFDIVSTSDILSTYTTYLTLLLITLIGVPLITVITVKVSKVIEFKDLKKDFIDDYQGIKKAVILIGTSFKPSSSKSDTEDAKENV